MNNLKMTPKDLLYLEDIFNWNITLVKKAKFYNENNSSSTVKSKLEEIIRLHDDICNKVIQIVKGAYDGR